MSQLCPHGSRLRFRRRPRTWLRGVTLIEMMIVIAIVGVIAAIAVPNLSPIVQRQKLTAAAEEVANLLDRARRAAYSDGRCARITHTGGILELRSKTGANGANCFDLTGASWDNRLGIYRPEPGLTITLSSTTAGEIVFRPNGRLRGDGDLVFNDDGAQISIVHSRLGEGIAVKVTPLSRVCKKDFSGSATAVSAPVTCP